MLARGMGSSGSSGEEEEESVKGPTGPYPRCFRSKNLLHDRIHVGWSPIVED